MDSPASSPVSLPAELSLLLFNMKQKKKVDTSGKTSDLYSEGTQFRTRADTDYSVQVFHNFLY